ncbi:hypothetical protein [Hydrogenimonas cancrithermarum]|uniref:Sel1 repeat family protein n=1 Tax=Hydrogenimonas cancrithermarum TaxID=2993563 RepID=A0ABM8FJJ1_9BACT|nr:hypothetical protein [Hydrogenimonas cancrithermarum]BDY12453.1 hypothetical protein HCR_07650 [Hydrogenimonas cancrithermarum]
MRKFFLIAALFVSGTILNVEAAECKGCSVGKLMLQCDYYVKRQGDLTKQHYCKAYAESVDIDGARAKAAWYFLLAGEPKKALASAKNALKHGHDFAAEYAALASAVLGDSRGAKRYISYFLERVKNGDYVKEDIGVLRKIYGSADFSSLTE